MLNESACFLIYILKSMLFLLAESYYRIPKNFYSEFRKTFIPKIFLPKNYFVYRKSYSFTEKLFTENLVTEKLFRLPKNYFVYRKTFMFTENLFRLPINFVCNNLNRFSVNEKGLRFNKSS